MSLCLRRSVCSALPRTALPSSPATTLLTDFTSLFTDALSRLCARANSSFQPARRVLTHAGKSPPGNAASSLVGLCMANISRETDPIVQSSHGQHSQRSNTELKDAACQLMQAVVINETSTNGNDSPELPRKPTLLELAQKSRARTENLSLQQLLNLSIAKDRWRTFVKIEKNRHLPEATKLQTYSPVDKESPSLATDNVCVTVTSSQSSGINDDVDADANDADVDDDDDDYDDETNLLTGNGADTVHDDSRDCEFESDDESWQVSDPRAKLISSV